MKEISNAQKAKLAIEAKKTYDFLTSLDLTDLTLEKWKRDTLFSTTGKVSSKELTASDFCRVLDALAILRGEKTSKVKKGYDFSPEAQVIWQIKNELQKWELSPQYLAKIVADKFPGRFASGAKLWETLRYKLTKPELLQLLYTIQARGKAQQGKAENNAEQIYSNN